VSLPTSTAVEVAEPVASGVGLDTRGGDLRASSPVGYTPWDGTHLNANTAVLARSGSGKSLATKLGVLRGLCRGVVAYVIDPEGEYADMARAARGRGPLARQLRVRIPFS